MPAIHILLLEDDAPQVLISDWMRQLKTAPSVMKTNRKLQHACCCNYLFRGRSVIVYYHFSFAMKFGTIFVVCYVQSTVPLFLDVQLCLSLFQETCVFPLFYFKIFFLCEKTFDNLVVVLIGFLCCLFFYLLVGWNWKLYIFSYFRNFPIFT